jgi:prepilin-type N-terminal cleavage/methylation domain-containing protein
MKSLKICLKLLKGFTLVELLVSSVLFAFIIGIILSTFYIADSTWKSDTDLVDLQQQVRLAMDGMIREIRQSRTADINITNGGADLDFAIGGNAIKYYLNNSQIIREYPQGSTSVLGNGISFLWFNLTNATAQANATVQVEVRGATSHPTRNLTFSLVEKVLLRN